MLAVLKAIGADGLGVPFTGAGPMAQALLSGTVMAITETPAVAAASNLPILAALSETRLAALPDVPTMKELGYPATSFTAGGVIAPGNTPPAVVATLEKACADATARAGVQDNRRAAQCRGALSAGRGVPQAVRRGFGGERRRGQADGAGGQIAARNLQSSVSPGCSVFDDNQAIDYDNASPVPYSVKRGRAMWRLFQAIVALLAGGVLAHNYLAAATAQTSRRRNSMR